MTTDELKKYYWAIAGRALAECARREVRDQPDLFLWYARRALEAVLLALLEPDAPRGKPERKLEELFAQVQKRGLLKNANALSHARFVRELGNVGAHVQRPERAPGEGDVSSTASVLATFVKAVAQEYPDAFSPEVTEALKVLRRSKSEHPPPSQQREKLQSELESLRRDLCRVQAERDALRAHVDEVVAKERRQSDIGLAPAKARGDATAGSPTGPRVKVGRAAWMAPGLLLLVVGTSGAVVLMLHRGDGVRVGTSRIVTPVSVSVTPPADAGSDEIETTAPSASTPPQAAPATSTALAGSVGSALSVEALQISSGSTSWRVGLPRPLDQVTQSNDVHEVSTPDGLRLRLYACSSDTWQQHRGSRVDHDHNGFHAFELTGGERPRMLFSERCLAGMKGAHICLRVLFRSEQEKLGTDWLAKVGFPKRGG